MTTAFLELDIERDEGCTLQAIPDVLTKGPPWTIGNGHTGLEVHPGLVWTPAEVTAARKADIAKATAGLDTALPWWRRLSDVRQDVLANMAFQMGVHGVLEFPKALAAIKAGDFEVAALQLADSEWARSETPRRAERLIAQMKSGVRAPQPGDPQMSDATTTPAAAPKPPTQSMTLQGAVLMVLLPIITPLAQKYLGVDAGQVTGAISAAGTLIGFAMVVIGRMRASQPIG